MRRFYWIALLVAWLLVEKGCGQSSGLIESDGQYDRECLMAILPAVSYSCRDRATRGPPPVGNGSSNSLLYSQSTRTLLGGFFQYCTSVGLKRPLYYLLPPTSLSAVLVAAADSMAAPFAAFPGDRLQKNFTRVGSLDALEDALLGYVSARRTRTDGLPYGYDSVITPYSGLQELRAAGLLTGLAGISSLDTLYQRGDIHPTLLDTVSYAGELAAVPLDGSQLLLYVRTDLLAAPPSGGAGGSGSSGGSSGGGFRVPDSWEQLLAVAAAVNGSAAAQLRPVVNATGSVSYAAATAPVFGFCMQPHTHMLGALALAVLAPLVQTNGSDQGMYLNADTLRPAATTAAMPYVLSYLRRLAAYSAPVAFSARAPQFSNDFALGRCAMTVGTAAQFRRNSHAAHPAGPSAVIGQVTTALLPGSEFVVTDVGHDWSGTGSWASGNNTGNGVLRRCDSRLCPAGQLTAGSAFSATALALAPTPPAGASQGAAPASTQALVNRAPLLSPDGTVGGVYGNDAEVMPQLYTWTMLSALGGPVNSWQLLLLPVSELGPWRLSHMETTNSALARWRAAGYSTADTASFLTAARAMLDHSNVVLPLRVRTAIMYVRAVRTAVVRLLNASSATPWLLQLAADAAGGNGTSSNASSSGRRAVLQAVASASASPTQQQQQQQQQQELLEQGLLTELTASLRALYGYGPTGTVDVTNSANGSSSGGSVPTREQMMQEYRRSLGLPYTPATTSTAVMQGDDDGGSNLPIGAVVGAVVGGVLVAALAGVVAFRAMRHRGRRRGRWRVVEAPGASADTVLLVTDIEGSTSLWEALPEEVMDRALRTHHITVRTVGIFFSAYEAATEGDSFILAFASATDAAQFALGLQRALLAARWPEELLSVPACAPVYVRKMDWIAKANQVSLAPAPTRRLGARPVRSRNRAVDGGFNKSLRFPSRNVAAVLGAFAGHSRARPQPQHASTSKRSVGGAHAAETAAGTVLPPAPGGFGRTGSAHAGHGPGLAGLGAGLLSRRWTSRRTSNDQAAIAAALEAEEEAADEEGQGAAAQGDDRLGPTAEEEALDAEVAAAVEAAAAAADPLQHGRSGGGAGAGNRHLLGRFWAAMDASGRPLQHATSRRRRRRSDTTLVAMMAAPYLERQSVPGHGDGNGHGDGGAGMPGGTGIGPGDTLTGNLLKFAMHGRQSLNVRGSPDLRAWSPGRGIGGASSLPMSPTDDNPDNSMYGGGRATAGAGDGERRGRLKSVRHGSVTFAAVAAAAISGGRAHDAGGGGGAGANSGPSHRPGRIRRASLAISNLLGLGSGAPSGGPGSAASAAATDAASGPEAGLTPRQMSRHVRRGSVLNTLLAGLGSPTVTGTATATVTGTGSAVPPVGTTDGGLTFTGATAAGVEGAGDAATAAVTSGGSAAPPPPAVASGSPHARRLRRASLALSSWLGLGHSGNAASGPHAQVATGPGAALRPTHSRRASSDAITATNVMSAAVPATTATAATEATMPALDAIADRAAPTDLAQPSPGAATQAGYAAGGMAAAAASSPHRQVNGFSVVALSAALAASEYKTAAASGADSTHLTGSSCGLHDLSNSGLAHPSNASGARARLLAGRVPPSPSLPAEEVPPDALAVATASQTTAAIGDGQPLLDKARSRRASSFMPRLLNLALFEAAAGVSGGPNSASGSVGGGGGNAPRSLKSQGSQMRRRYSTVLERALSPRGKTTAGTSAAATAASGGASGGGGVGETAAPELAAVPGVSTWGSELGMEDGAEKWAELKWQLSSKRTGDAPAISSGGPRATSGGAGATSGTTSRHSAMLTSQLTTAATATAAAASSARPKLDIARVFSIAHMQDSSLLATVRCSAANTGATVSGAASTRGGAGATGGTGALDFGQGSPVPGLSGGASPLFPPGLPQSCQDRAGVAGADGPASERQLAAPAPGLGLPSASEPQVRSGADSGELPTRRTAPDMPPMEQLLATPLQYSQSQPNQQLLQPTRQLQQGGTASGERTSQPERGIGAPPVAPAATCSPAPPSGAPSPMPPSQQIRTGALSALGSGGAADASPADERWSLAGVIIGTGGASGRAASSSSPVAGPTPPVVSPETAKPHVRGPAVPLSLLLPANSPPPGAAGTLSSAGDESLLAVRGSVGGGAGASAYAASVPLPLRSAHTAGQVMLSPQPPAGPSGGSSALRQPVAVCGGPAGTLPLALQAQVQREGAPQWPAGSPSASQLQQAQPVRSAAAAGPVARLLARPQAPTPLLVSPRHSSPQVPSAASPGYPHPPSSATNPNTPTAAAAALSAAPSSASAAAAAAALHRRFSELAAELAKPPVRARSQAGSGSSPHVTQPDQLASPRRGGFSITAGGSGRKQAQVSFDRSRTFSSIGGEAAAVAGGASDRGERSERGDKSERGERSGATAALAAVVAGALKFSSFSRRAASSGPRAPLPRSQHAQHFLTAAGGYAAVLSPADGTQSATLPYMAASGAAAAAASQSGGSSRMARLEYTSSRRRVGAGLEPLERLEEETGGAASQTVPLPQPLPQSPAAVQPGRPPLRLRSSGAVSGTSAAGNDPDLQPSAAADTGLLTPKHARGTSDGGGGGGGGEARPSRSSILPSTLQLLLKRSGTGGSSRKAGLFHFADPASIESGDLLSGIDGSSGRGQAPKSPAQVLPVPKSAELDAPSLPSAHGVDVTEIGSRTGGANGRASLGGGFGSAIVPLAEPPCPHGGGTSAGEVGGGAGMAALGFVKPSVLIPIDNANTAALPEPFAHDQPALMSPDAAGAGIGALATAASNVSTGPQHTEPLQPVHTSGVARAGSIMTYAPASRAVKPPTHGSLLELLHRVFVRADDSEAAEGHLGHQTQQQQLQQQRSPDMQLVFAGLRVRVGLHCGVTDARDIQYNAATARMTFGGEGLRIAKAVCDCASGGQVVMSGEVLLRLQLVGSGGVLLLQQQQMLLQGQTHVLDLGDHQLMEAAVSQPQASSHSPPPDGTAGVPGAVPAHPHPHPHNPAPTSEPSAAVPVSRHLLCIAAPALLGRMAVIPPVRSALHQFTPGFMDAPVGPAVCVVVFRVSNAAALAAWNAAVASEAMALLELYLRASLGALINTSSSGADPSQPQSADYAGPQTGRGGAANTANRLACYLAAAPPGSPFGTFVAGFSQPAAAARWALTTVARTAELPWPAELLESQWGRPLEEVTRVEAEVADAAAAAAAGGGNILPYAFGSGAGGTTANSPGGASSFLHGGGSPPRAGAFAAIGGSVGSRMARLLRTAPVGWISSPLSLGSHKGSGRHGSGTAADRGADSSPLVSGTVLLSLPPPARGGGPGVVVGGAVSTTEASSAAFTEMGGWAPVEVEVEEEEDDDVETGEPSTAGADLSEQPPSQPPSQHSAVAAVGAGGSGRLHGASAAAGRAFLGTPMPLPAQPQRRGHAPSVMAAAALTSWDARREGGALPPAAELYEDGGTDMDDVGPVGSTGAQGARYHPNGVSSAASASQLPPMPGGRGVGPAAVRSGGVGSPVRGHGVRSVLGGGSGAGGSGVMRSGGSASRLPMPSRFALAAEANDFAAGAPSAAPMSSLARAAGPTTAAVLNNTEIVVMVEPELSSQGQVEAAAAAASEGGYPTQGRQAQPQAAAGSSTVPARFLGSAEGPSAASRALRPKHTSEHGAEGPPPAAMAAAGSASGLGLSGLPPGARRMPSATGLAPPTQRLRNRLLQHLTLSFTSLSRKAMGGSPVAGSRFGGGSGAGDAMDSQPSPQETESAGGSGAGARTMSGPVHLHSPGDWPVAGASGRGARGVPGAASAVTPTPRPALGAAGLPSGAGSAVTGAGLEEAAAAAAAAARAEEDAEVVSFRGLRVRLGMAIGPVRVELCPLTGRVVYSGKTVTTAMTSAASARLGTLLANQGVAEAIAAAQGGAGLMLQFPSGYHSSRQDSNRHDSTRQDSNASHATAHAAPAVASGPWRKAMFRRALTVADDSSAHAAVDRRGGAAAHAAAAPDGHAPDPCPVIAASSPQQAPAPPSGNMLTGFKRRSGGSIARARTSSIASPERRMLEPAPRSMNVPASSSSSQPRNSGGSSARPSPATAGDVRLGAPAVISSVAIPTTLPEADDEMGVSGAGVGNGGEGCDDLPWANSTEPGESHISGDGAVGADAAAHTAGDKASGGAEGIIRVVTKDRSLGHETQVEVEQEQPEMQGPGSQAAVQPQLLCTPAVGGGLGVAFGGGGGGGGLAVPRLNPKNPTFRVRLQLEPPAPLPLPQQQQPYPQAGPPVHAPAPELAAIRHGV